MKTKRKTFRARLWQSFFLFAAILFVLLWLLQTVFLQSLYTGMAVSGLEKTAALLAGEKDSENFFAAIDEAAREKSLLIFLTEERGRVLYSADEYNQLYTENGGAGNHSGGNPYFTGDGSLSWEKGALRNLPASHVDLIGQLLLSGESSLGYVTESGSAYVYGVKLGQCASLPGNNVLMCISMPLSSLAGTAGILRTQLLWVSLFSIGLAFVLAFFLSRKFERPIRNITKQAKSIAEGDFHPAQGEGFCVELDELSETLNETAASLDRLENARQELLANISHDLRTPLTMIRGYAEMVREISWSDEEKRNQDLRIIEREADRLTAMVNEILEYSSLQSQRWKPDMEDFDLSAALRRVIARFGLLCSEQGINIEQNIEPTVFVRGNPAQIERVIYNFVDNALNHTGSSGRITVSLCTQADSARLEVQDYGPGIPPEELPYIWDRYYTARNRKNKSAVSGLGLAIAKEILSLHEAPFGVSGENGCAFWFEMNKT